MVKLVTDAQHRIFQADFEQFDRNASGFLEGREIRMLLAKQLSLTGPATKRQLDSFLEECDVDKDGRISFEEYLDVMLGRCWRLIGQGLGGLKLHTGGGTDVGWVTYDLFTDEAVEERRTNLVDGTDVVLCHGTYELGHLDYGRDRKFVPEPTTSGSISHLKITWSEPRENEDSERVVSVEDLVKATEALEPKGSIEQEILSMRQPVRIFVPGARTYARLLLRANNTFAYVHNCKANVSGLIDGDCPSGFRVRGTYHESGATCTLKPMKPSEFREVHPEVTLELDSDEEEEEEEAFPNTGYSVVLSDQLFMEGRTELKMELPVEAEGSWMNPDYQE